MKIEDLIEIVRADYLDDTVRKFLSDDNFMLRSFSEAQKQACNRSEMLFDDATDSVCKIQLLSGVPTYRLSETILRIDRAELYGKELAHRAVQELDRTDSSWRTHSGMANKSVNYVVRGRQIRFSPMPDANDSGEIVSMEVYRLPLTPLIDIGQSPEIPEEYHRDLIWWVLGEAYSKRDEDTGDENTGLMPRATLYFGQFESVFGDYVSAEVRKNQLEQPKSLVHRPISYIGQSIYIN